MALTSTGAGTPRSRLVRQLVVHRRPIQVVGDVFVWALVVPLSSFLRYDFDYSRMETGRLSLYLTLAVVLQLGIGTFEGLYTGRYSFGSFEEVLGMARTVLAITAVGAIANVLVFPSHLPRSVPFVAGTLALASMAAVRYTWRLLVERQFRPTIDTARPTIVFGAGEGGAQLVTSMLRDPDSPYLPVALLDDDPRKRRLRLRDVPVVGTRHDMAKAKDATRAELLIIAVPSASGPLVRELAEEAATAGLEVRILPPVGELLGSPSVGDVRRLSETDLLGRHEIDTDLDSISDYVAGKRVLVTGAGGSIGSELCRQLYRLAPAELVMLDHDESALHDVQLSIHGRAMLTDELVVADIRDKERLLEVFDDHRPEVVFHAAALKHLTLLERFPDEGVKTNVFGTLHVLEAARRGGVERFVNISTDKAADPTSMLGYTKRIAERLTAAVADETDGTYLSVRFGNVLGSRGSVLTAFRAQLEAGGPVTVTHPDVTRYFMTVEEAVQLVIQAGAVGGDGEALILDMGAPIKIAEVAQRMIEASGKQVEIVYTGLRPGEKLHEILRATHEPDHRPHHPLISHVPVPPLPIERVRDSPAAAVAREAKLLCDPCRAVEPVPVTRQPR